MSNQAKVRIWSSDEVVSKGFPEEKYDYLEKKKNVGVCISGGGTVSMSAGVGWLRGLHELGLLQNIRYYSGVSGGSWIGVPFTFLPQGKSVENFLGGELLANADPAKLTPELLNNLDKESLNYSITKSQLMSKALNNLDNHVPEPEAFAEALGETFLSSQGLFDPKDKKFFTLNRESLNAILDNNPSLKADQFRLASPDRPFMIANATMVYPIESAAMSFTIHKEKPHIHFKFNITPTNLHRFEYTPLYCGCLTEETGVNPGNLDLGGGYVEAFGFNTVQTKPAGTDMLGVDYDSDNTIFKLCDIMGSSGSAPAAFVESVEPQLKKLFSCFNYWPVMKPGQKSQLLSFADGGTIENTGVVAMLKRKVPKIIAFDSATGSGLTYTEKGGKTIDPNSISSDIRQLFGRGNAGWFKDTKRFQVFESQEFDKLAAGFEEKLNAGESVMYRGTFTVMKNDFFGLEGGNTVDILWVYNNGAAQWREKITPDVSKLIVDPFPNYDTFFPPDGKSHWGAKLFKSAFEAAKDAVEVAAEDFIRWLKGEKAKKLGFDWVDFTLVGMTPSETALLSHISYWNVVNDTSADAFRAMLE